MAVTDLVFVDSTGFHVADFPSFLLYVQNLFKGIYGPDIYIEPDSQDGQLIAAFAQSLFDTASVGQSTYNSQSPATAQGVGLSRIVKINGLNRRAATKSTSDLTIVGVSGTVINNGIAQDSVGQKWNLPAVVTIPPAGTIVATATADQAGNVNAEASTITKIFTPTLGWQTVTNAAPATAGIAAETDAELRIRQALSTANPSLTVFDGTIGALENLDGVIVVRGYENDTGSTDGNGIPAHTISCVVEGGDVTQICQTIQVHKTPGVGTYGTTSELVFDAKGMPLTINFFRPTLVTISVEVTITTFVGYTSNYGDQIKQSVAAYINSIGIGDDVLLTKIYPPAYLPPPASTTYDITLVRTKKNAGSFGTSNIAIAFNELPACDVSNITLIVT